MITARLGAKITGKRVLVVEDGPTLTHGGMATGAGVEAARQFGAAEIIDPRPYARGSLAETYAKYPHLGPILPAVGYYRGSTARSRGHDRRRSGRPGRERDTRSPSGA